MTLRTGCAQGIASCRIGSACDRHLRTELREIMKATPGWQSGARCEDWRLGAALECQGPERGLWRQGRTGIHTRCGPIPKSASARWAVFTARRALNLILSASSGARTSCGGLTDGWPSQRNRGTKPSIPETPRHPDPIHAAVCPQ